MYVYVYDTSDFVEGFPFAALQADRETVAKRSTLYTAKLAERVEPARIELKAADLYTARESTLCRAQVLSGQSFPAETTVQVRQHFTSAQAYLETWLLEISDAASGKSWVGLASLHELERGARLSLSTRPRVVAQSEALVTSFADHTAIETEHGPVPAGDITVGTMVRTLHNWFQPVSWVGKRRMLARGADAPVRISQGVLGNPRALVVSPNHRVMVTETKEETPANELVAVRHLINDLDIHQRQGGWVTYVQLFFETHQIIFAEGVPSESFFPEAAALQGLGDGARSDFLTRFPQYDCDADAAKTPILA